MRGVTNQRPPVTRCARLWLDQARMFHCALRAQRGVPANVGRVGLRRASLRLQRVDRGDRSGGYIMRGKATTRGEVKCNAADPVTRAVVGRDRIDTMCDSARQRACRAHGRMRRLLKKCVACATAPPAQIAAATSAASASCALVALMRGCPFHIMVLSMPSIANVVCAVEALCRCGCTQRAHSLLCC
jgi:hypothetical protein